jgi:hypothetical protein
LLSIWPNKLIYNWLIVYEFLMRNLGLMQKSKPSLWHFLQSSKLLGKNFILFIFIFYLSPNEL